MHYSLIHIMQQGMFCRIHVILEQDQYNYLKVKIFTFRSQELQLKKQAAEKKL